MLDFLPLSQETSRSRFFRTWYVPPTFESLNQICFAYKPALSLGLRDWPAGNRNCLAVQI